MTNGIDSLADLRPGDIMFGPIGGLVGAGVGLGQLLLGEAFRAGKTSIRHVGIVVEKAHEISAWDGATYPGEIRAPRLVQAMPHGAEEVTMTEAQHWTDRHAYVRLEQDYPGQAEDAASIARLMVQEGVAYSPLSYAALALWHYGVKAPKLAEWIDRRREPVPFTFPRPSDAQSQNASVRLPVEAICSVLVDQAWSMVGKRVMRDVAHQAVTPGAMANQLWRRPGVLWSFPGDVQ